MRVQVRVWAWLWGVQVNIGGRVAIPHPHHFMYITLHSYPISHLVQVSLLGPLLCLRVGQQVDAGDRTHAARTSPAVT